MPGFNKSIISKTLHGVRSGRANQPCQINQPLSNHRQEDSLHHGYWTTKCQLEWPMPGRWMEEIWETFKSNFWWTTFRKDRKINVHIPPNLNRWQGTWNLWTIHIYRSRQEQNWTIPYKIQRNYYTKGKQLVCSICILQERTVGKWEYGKLHNRTEETGKTMHITNPEEMVKDFTVIGIRDTQIRGHIIVEGDFLTLQITKQKCHL